MTIRDCLSINGNHWKTNACGRGNEDLASGHHLRNGELSLDDFNPQFGRDIDQSCAGDAAQDAMFGGPRYQCTVGIDDPDVGCSPSFTMPSAST